MTAQEICVHDIKPEFVPTPGRALGGVMKLHVMGHVLGGSESVDEIFSLIAAVPNMAIFASRILEEVGKADELSQIITAIALSRELEETTKREAASPPVEAVQDSDALARLSEIFGSSMGGMIVPLDGESQPEGKGYAKNATDDDPVRILKLQGEPSFTFAPVDNRDEYPEGMNGYL
jgi:hypothetical protein